MQKYKDVIEILTESYCTRDLLYIEDQIPLMYYIVQAD